MDIKNIAHKGLLLAENGRRNDDELDCYWDLIGSFGDIEIWLKDSEDGTVYRKSLSEIPYMGNKSARLAEVIDDQTTHITE